MKGAPCLGLGTRTPPPLGMFVAVELSPQALTALRIDFGCCCEGCIG